MIPCYGITVNIVLLVRVPLGVWTVTNPLVAPVGTVARIEVSDTTVKLAGVPFNQTAVVPMRPRPSMPPI